MTTSGARQKQLLLPKKIKDFNRPSGRSSSRRITIFKLLIDKMLLIKLPTKELLVADKASI